MKVLMFGWEFPPHISGGLGTACYGLTKGLLQNGLDVTFVVPKASGDEDTSRFKIISAHGLEVHNYYQYAEKLDEKFTFLGVNTPVLPYLSPEAFETYNEEDIQTVTEINGSKAASFKFTGRYGRDLIKEVRNYALVATEIAASQEFDIIHAHDWLSFPAGIMAKQVSGKPLIVHIHATEFDRSGETVNTQVYEIEREVMLAADKIIAVSEFTRQIIIDKYEIPAGKVVAIHNGIEELQENTIQIKGKNFKEKIITYLGRVTYQKGPNILSRQRQNCWKETGITGLLWLAVEIC